MDIPEAGKCANTQAASRQIHRKPQARRNSLGKIYYIYIFCALVFTDPVQLCGVGDQEFQQQNEEHFSRLEIQLYIVQDP